VGTDYMWLVLIDYLLLLAGPAPHLTDWLDRVTVGSDSDNTVVMPLHQDDIRVFVFYTKM